ncbi:MAG: hypothetical protein ACK5LP_05085 [Campylobacteraceae bacterium]
MPEIKRERPLGEIICQNIQSVYATINTTEPLERGTLLVSNDAGVTFSVVAVDGENANGVLLDYVNETKKAAVLVTGSVVETNIVGLRDVLKPKLFENKIILK